MSIYKKVLGDQFNLLHPMLQKRYDIVENRAFNGSGIMTTIKGGPGWLYPLFKLGVTYKLLFPERGHNIPFTIVNSYRIGHDGEEQIHWERIFHFGKKKRYFNALMSLDPNRNVIKDYLGEPSLFYSDLALQVTKNGQLTITSLRQRLVLGKLEIPLPKIFQGLATVTEMFDDESQLFLIKVVVKNPLIGTVFLYEGEFSTNDWD